MNILIACEFSGVVREAFSRRGHNVWSCDLLPSEIPGKHFQEDVSSLLDEGWDMMLAFPPCTHLSSAGAQYWKAKQADGRQALAIEFAQILFNANIKMIALENPVGILSRVLGKPTQYIEPFQFGDPYYKKTCLWLKGLPALQPTKFVAPIDHWIDSGRTRGLHRNAKDRSRTFPGIAKAMADQWG